MVRLWDLKLSLTYADLAMGKIDHKAKYFERSHRFNFKFEFVMHLILLLLLLLFARRGAKRREKRVYNLVARAQHVNRSGS